MTRPRTAMILAAGLGLRMRPLTDDRPKAMINVLGQPLIGHLLDFLAAIDIKTIVVNIHYRPEPLIAYLVAHPLSEKIKFSDERKNILQTGGGVRAALSHFAEAPFFVANCDAYFPASGENPFLTLSRVWRTKDMSSLLLLKKTENALGYDGAGDFFKNPDGRLQRRGDKAQAPFAFTGVQILTPSLFEGIADKVFSLNKIYDRALAREELFGVVCDDPWLHMGTPDMVPAAESYGP